MFEWFIGGRSHGRAGLDKMRSEFGQMLDAGRHIFDTAANALLGGTNLQVIRRDLFATDKRINSAEQQIRREIVVHAAVHGTAVFANCLVLMSVVKDAERVGDYGKNIFDLAELSPHAPEGKYRDDLVALKDRISQAMAECRKVFDVQDHDQAKRLIRTLQEIEDVCDVEVAKFIKAGQEVDIAPTYALAYRYFKRIASHLRNVTTSVVQPIDKLDFADQSKGGEGQT